MKKSLSNSFIFTFFIALLTYLSALCVSNMGLLGATVKTIAFYSVIGLGAVCMIWCFFRKDEVFRTLFILVVVVTFFSAVFLLLDKSGFWNNISSIENMQDFIRSQGVYSYLVFLAIQFLQVVAVPIPGTVTVAAGVVVFGVFWGALLSFIGIVIGSLVAFWIGRKFGYKLVVWVIGEKNLIKTLELIKGRDKVIFAMMFLLPFFPDDMLCFVAGLTPMSFGFFAGMLIVTRIITTVALAYTTEFSQFLLMGGSTIHYILLAALVLAIIIIFILSIKYGDRIQRWYEKKFSGRLNGARSGSLVDDNVISLITGRDMVSADSGAAARLQNDKDKNAVSAGSVLNSGDGADTPKNKL